MEIRFYFDDGTDCVLPCSESTLIHEMAKPKNKRLYRCGIEFSRVIMAEVVKNE